MSRFVRPETRSLTLSDGDTLTVRARLSNGEQRAMWARSSVRDPDATDPSVIRYHGDPLKYGGALVTAYLLNWTLRDDAGQLVDIKARSVAELETVLDSLTPEAFNEIHAAIAAHVAAMDSEREIEKKTPVGVGAS